MGVVQRINRASTRKGKQFLKERAPRVVEASKRTLFVRGLKTSQNVNECMKDLCRFRKPNGTYLNRKNNWHPFEDITPFERFSKKYDASLFMYASHSKKRPNNLVVGRMFDGQLLDMIELGLENFKKSQDFKNEKLPFGTKPCLLFCGSKFDQQYEYIRLKNLLIDFFQFKVMKFIRLQGLEHVLMFSATDDKILMRSYRITFKKSGTRTPRVELQEIGPSLDLSLRRVKLASEDLFKQATRQPKELKVKKVKNVSKDGLGTAHGRIHIPKQNIGKIQTRKMKGLKKSFAERKAEKKGKTKDFNLQGNRKRNAPEESNTNNAVDKKRQRNTE